MALVICGLTVDRFAAFSRGPKGGNPAGVVICEELPDAPVMQAVAAQVGYSETVFAAPINDGWRVRYFAPEIEIPFCGHATIALAAALAIRKGSGFFHLQLNAAQITVQGRYDNSGLSGALQSPPTHSEPAPRHLIAASLALFGYTLETLDNRLPPAIIEAGARHLVMALRDRSELARMRYVLKDGRKLMLANRLATICLIYVEMPNLFHARNPFAAGGVYEDPATGAAAAALGGYLRDLGWPHGGSIVITQGEDMKVPSRLHVGITPEPGQGVRVAGNVRKIT